MTKEDHPLPVPLDSRVRVPTTELEIHYRDWGGQESSPMLLLHGLASTGRIYDLCAPLLAGNHRVVAYDQRGHGESAKPDTGYDFPTLVADGDGLVKALQLKAPLVVVGHSWGAMVALEWALQRPNDVKAVVLIDGAVSGFRDMPDVTWQIVQERFAPPSWEGATMNGLLALTRQHLSFLSDEYRRAYFEGMVEARPDGSVRARLSRENHLRILRSMWDEDLDAAYQDLRRPALALLAVPVAPDATQRDMLETRVRAAKRRVELQPLLQARWLEDTIHDVPLQRPELVASEIETWLSSLP